MKHAIIPGVMQSTRDPRALVDPFAPGGDALESHGPTHEDMAGGPFVLLENVEVHVLWWNAPWVAFVPLSYRSEGADAWRGGPVRGMRPLINRLNRNGMSRFGSQMELDFRYAAFGPGKGRYREANGRAKELLLECLNPLQRLYLKWGRFFYVRGQVNPLYKIELGNGAAVVDPYTHDERLTLCYHPETFMPYEDTALATKLLIESGTEGEELLLKTARTRLVKPRRYKLDAKQAVEQDATCRELWAMERELLAA